MFTLAILIGGYSYFILALGLLGLLYPHLIAAVSSVFLFLIFWWQRKNLTTKGRQFKGELLCCDRHLKTHLTVLFLRSIFNTFIVSLLVFLAVVNLIGALGPELGFDALWYHLTLPKIYLESSRISFIPGNLLYYSVMPRLTEMLYLAALAIQGEILAKVIHWGFGILSVAALYKLAKKYFTTQTSLLVALVFYSTLIVGWQSVTAYVDLTRTFFEVLALWAFLEWWESRKMRWLMLSAVIMGLAISTKILALGSLFVFTVLIVFHSVIHRESEGNWVIRVLGYWVIGLLVSSPWFYLAYKATGNPVYPLFSGILDKAHDLAIPPFTSLATFAWDLTFKAQDPVSPIYLAFLPIVVLSFKKFKPALKIVALYSLLAWFVFWLIPKTGGSRFILPYLPAFSLVLGSLWEIGWPNKFQKILAAAVIFVAIFHLGYRVAANSKFLPVILGQEIKQEFLTKYLPFETNVFYDTDGYFAKNINAWDRVLILGTHNLFYVNFPFIHESWYREGEKFNYILTQNTDLPQKFGQAPLVYNNPKTGVKLYKTGD